MANVAFVTICLQLLLSMMIKKFTLQIPIIWFGNLIGTGIIALISMATRNGAKLSAAAQGLCDVKMADSYISLFLLGIFCNIMIYISVEGYGKIQYEMGKYLSLFLGVMVFILSGFEHSIADMFYFSMAGLWSGKALLAIAVISVGNAAGGILIHQVRAWKPN